MSSFTVRRFALATTALALTGAPYAPAHAALCTWSGGAGDWSNAAKWSCGGVPGSGDSIHIDGQSNITSAVSVTSTQYAGNVTIDSGDSLAISNATLGVYNSAFVNNGAVVIGSNGTLVGLSGGTIFSGTGTITLNDTGSGAYLYTSNGNQMTFGAGQTVSGAGYIGRDQGVTINNGTINANASGAYALNLDAQGGSGGIGAGNGVGTNNATSFLNTGLLEATSGGTLNFVSGLYENQGGGAILASGAGSSVVLGNDVRILGGSITGSNGGAINALNGTQYLDGITLGSGTTLTIANDVVRFDNTFTNGGTIAIGASSQLIGESAVSSIAGGSITLAGNNSYFYNTNGTKMTLTSGTVVSGAGYIGQDQGVLVNNGTINANLNGQILNLDAQGGSGGIGTNNGVGTNGNSAFLNTGLLEATGGGALNFVSGLYENQGNGAILASGTGSSILLSNDVRIVGGTITGSGGGVVNALNGTQYLQGVTLGSGTPLAISADVVRISSTAANGGLVNNGTITISNGGVLVGESAATALAGTGSIVLAASNAGSAYLYDYNGTQMTIGSGQSIRGTGYIGQDQGVIVNNGVITATAGAGGLTLDAQGGSGGIGTNNGVGTNGNSAFLNNNLIQATGGGALYFNSGLYENAAGGQMLAVGNGSQIVLNNDVRILGGTLGGTVTATGGNQYVQNLTLANGTAFTISGDVVRIDNTLTNNGTITIGTGAVLFGETPASAIVGNGAIVLTDPSSSFYDGNGTQMTIGAGQFVHGTGSIGLDQGLITNAGNILADGAITIDAQGGSSGLGGNGLGTGGNAGFYNAAGGQVQANNGGATLTLAGGLYEQAAGASFSVGTGSSFVMGNDSNLANLQSGGVLNKGMYFAFAGGTMSLRSNQTGAITTIGSNAAGTDTSVALSGAGSVISVMPSGGGNATSLDQSLNTIAASGALSLSEGRSFIATNGAFSNAGLLQLNSGASFTAPAGLTNSGTILGNGAVGTPITNSGSVIADGGTLFARAITGASGTIQSNASGTLDLSGAAGASTAGFLTNNGTLALGNNSITVTSDYTNANFGSGNAFNAHANVTGSGLILAASATQDLSGPGLSGSLLNVGNVRLGGSSSTTLTITNNGTLTTLRGAVESPLSNSVSISSDNFVVGPNGGSATVTLSYTGSVAGSLAGNTITVANNFDNVANKTLSIVGAAYNPAAASILPTTIDLGATRVGGTLAGSITIANTAPVGAYSEKLAVTGAVGAGGASGTAPVGLINPGASSTSAISLGTATSGSYSGTVTYGLATDGTGTSGLAQAALSSQSVTVSGRVYQAANAQLSTTSVNFGTVRQGSAAPTATVAVTNTANGALTDHLNTSIGSLPTGVTGTAPASLAGGTSGNASFSQSTATAGQYNGTGTLNFTSTNAELSPLALASQNIAFSGTVTELAIAQLSKGAGAGTFAGSGQSFTLDLGSIAAGAGSLTTGFDIFNANSGQSYSELLNGMFNLSGGAGYSFSGGVSGLAGGATDANNWLTFNYSGLAAGNYNDTLTFLGYSHYTGLDDYALTPITVNIHAIVTGGGGGIPGGVPEPTTWTMLILGFGAVAGALRRRRRAEARASL